MAWYPEEIAEAVKGGNERVPTHTHIQNHMSTPAQPLPQRNRTLHIILWVLQVVLAAFFLMVGFNHAFNPIEEAAKSAPWMSTVPPFLPRFIGVVEILGALGLILPAGLRIKPGLTSLAALGLALVMLFAAVFHLMRGEQSAIGFVILPMLLALFVAWGRRKRAAIAPRS